MTFIDILKIIAILAYGVLVGWIIYKLMKNADRNEDDENNKGVKRK